LNKTIYNKSLFGILFLSDIISGYFAIWIVFSNNYLNTLGIYTQTNFLFNAIIIQCFWFPIFYFANLYDTRATLSRFEEIIRIVPLVYTSLIVLISGHLYGIFTLPISPKDTLSYGLIFLGILITNRFVVHTIQKSLLNRNIGLNNALILGVNRRGEAIFNELLNHSYHGLNIKGFVRASDDPDSFDDQRLPMKILGLESDLINITEIEKINDIIIALDKPNPERIISTISKINGLPISIKILPDMYEVVTGLARTNQLVGLPLIDINFNLETFYSQRLKRLIDIFCGFLGLFICFPLWVFIGILIKLDSRGPIFYRQERVGKDGKIFFINKFRSMVSDAEAKTGPVWAATEDDRITSVGKLLRRFHFDETPQLINILKGDMSIIGPRPERPYFVKKLKETYPFYSRRFKIRPGVSGWSQINQPFDVNVKDVHQKLKFDFFYIENMSLNLDIKILFKTIMVVLRGHPNH
tara:strand:+ start:110222 stop:111628 length:1407 start_codon:yes stop_codon:yes gene_type:complete